MSITAHAMKQIGHFARPHRQATSNFACEISLYLCLDFLDLRLGRDGPQRKLDKESRSSPAASWMSSAAQNCQTKTSIIIRPSHLYTRVSMSVISCGISVMANGWEMDLHILVSR
jgi:hypothetical protein